MNQWMNRLYEKNELYFALVWIGIYCIANSLAIPLSAAIGINSVAALVFNTLLTLILFRWIRKNHLEKHYGLCRTNISPGRFLWYLPLVAFAFRNLWFGVAANLPLPDMVCYILSMLLVGFLEELFFRGFLFKALAKDNVKVAVFVSSITFGLGHILNLFNGRGMDLLVNICQVTGAMACGFLFVIIFHRGGSLFPCIWAHAINNIASAFADETGITPEKRLQFSAVSMVIVIGYALILCRTLPEKAATAQQEHKKCG